MARGNLTVTVKVDAREAIRQLRRLRNQFWWAQHGQTTAILIGLIAFTAGLILGRAT